MTNQQRKQQYYRLMKSRIKTQEAYQQGEIDYGQYNRTMMVALAVEKTINRDEQRQRIIHLNYQN